MANRNLTYSTKSDRGELDIKIGIVLLLGFILSLGVYSIFLPIQDSFLGILLYERGFTQFVAIFFGCMVVTITILKLFKIKTESTALNKDLIPTHIALENPNSVEVQQLQNFLIGEKSLLARRCSRVLGAYAASGNRQTATEFAMEDSAFYSNTAETSYSVARILVWAIPLLGFIGTVFGISGAVSGFSRFLEQSSDIEQIKQGIGTVTSGLAVAFDTTLLALFVSVLVMIPLVLVERQESRLLMAIDVYINDRLLPRLQQSEGLNKATVNDVLNQAFQKHLPSPEVLIKPAQEYAQQAAQALAQGFLQQIGTIESTTAQLIQQMHDIHQIAVKEQENLMSSLNQQQQSSQDIVKEIQHISTTFQDHYQNVNQNMSEHTTHITQQLQNAGMVLETCTLELTKIVEFQSSVAQSLQNLDKTGQLEQVLGDLKSNLALLTAALEQLNKPRRITLIEAEDNHR